MRIRDRENRWMQPHDLRQVRTGVVLAMRPKLQQSALRALELLRVSWPAVRRRPDEIRVCAAAPGPVLRDPVRLHHRAAVVLYRWPPLRVLLQILQARSSATWVQLVLLALYFPLFRHSVPNHSGRGPRGRGTRRARGAHRDGVAALRNSNEPTRHVLFENTSLLLLNKFKSIFKHNKTNVR